MRFSRLALGALVAVGLVAGPTLAGTERAARADGIVLDRIVAVVNDEIILRSELEEQLRLDPRLQQAIQELGPNPTPQQIELEVREMRVLKLDELINERLVLQEAERFQITATDQQLQAYLQNLATSNGLASVAELRGLVEQSGEFGTWEEYTSALRKQIIVYQVEGLLAPVSVTDAQVRDYYRKMSKGEDAKVEVVRFDFRPADDAPKAKDAAYTLAKRTVSRLSAGVPEDKIGEELGKDSGVVSIARGDVAPKLEDAVFNARKGQIVGPLASGQGYVVLEHLESDVVPFEQAKEKIRQLLTVKAEQKASAELHEQLRGRAHIEIRL